MSANSFHQLPIFLEDLNEADRFIAVIKCIRELKMHSILVPQARTLGGKVDDSEAMP